MGVAEARKDWSVGVELAEQVRDFPLSGGKEKMEATSGRTQAGHSVRNGE